MEEHFIHRLYKNTSNLFLYFHFFLLFHISLQFPYLSFFLFCPSLFLSSFCFFFLSFYVSFPSFVPPFSHCVSAAPVASPYYNLTALGDNVPPRSRRRVLEYIAKLVRYSPCFENREYYHSQVGAELPVKRPFFITPKCSSR